MKLLQKLVGLLAFVMAWRPGALVASNIAEGTRAHGRITRLSAAAIGRYLCVKVGADAMHAAACAAVTDRTIGVTTDEATAAEEPINIQLIGGCGGTFLVTAGANVTLGSLVATMANGRVQNAVATQYAIGIALQAGANGDVIEVMPLASDRALT